MKELNNLKILYVEDEDLIRLNAIDYLSLYCKHVYEAKDGLEGLKKYKEKKPDIIITDIEMPKLNGLDMVKEIRKKDKDTKIIVVTAFLETSYLLQAVELGLIKYLEKPITQNKLLPILNSCFEDLIKGKNIFNLDKEFTFDIYNKTLFKNEQKVFLAKKELLSLELLIKNYKRAVSFREFDNYVWNGEMSIEALRTVIRDLRVKISKDSIKSISGIGYHLDICKC